MQAGAFAPAFFFRKGDNYDPSRPGDPPCPASTSPPNKTTFNQELQVCIAEALYDVDSIVADPEAYTKDELAALHSQILSNLEQAWEIVGGSEDQLAGDDGADWSGGGEAV